MDWKEMASEWRPEIPTTRAEELLGLDLGNELEREVYRRYRKRRSFGSSFSFQKPERTPVLHRDTCTQVTSMKQDPEYTSQQDYVEDFSQVKVLYEDQLVTPTTARGLPLSYASTPSLKLIKLEPEEVHDTAESSFGQFASILNSALQGLVSFSDLIQQFELCCCDLVEHLREEATERHRVIEDQILRQKAQMLHGESATWALLWHLFGKGSNVVDLEDDLRFSSTSQQVSCSFILADSTAQLCFRIVQWLEGLAANALDVEKKHKGWYAGSYLQRLGVWHQTQRAIRRKAGNAVLVQHLDPDAPTREHAHLHAEDQKLEEGLLEDVWKLLRAGRLEEAKQLCRSAGQPWRAATLGGCGWLGASESLEAWTNKSNVRALLAIECESGLGHQWRLWKWACFCASEKIAENVDENRFEAAIYAAQCGNVRRMLPVCKDWETACWAMVRSWLDVQVDLELARVYPVMDRTKLNGAVSDMNEAIVDVNMEAPAGPNSWPQQVLNQQPRDLRALFQKLHSGDLVHESVIRGCKDNQHQIQMCIMLGDVAQLLELLRAWIVPSQDGTELVRPPGHPQMMRFGAHLVLVLRHILADDVKELFREKLWLIGDLILNTYAIFLFTQRREELVGVYASQLAPYLCEELYVHMMELRQHDSVLVKYKIFRSALEYLPYGPEDSSKGCVSNILDRVLSGSREVKPVVTDFKFEDTEEYNHRENLQKAMAVQWLCFIPPSNLPTADQSKADLLARAIHQSNILFREFSVISLLRTPRMPVGAHMLLEFLAEPLKQSTESLFAVDQQSFCFRANFLEFQDWREYYSCDTLYRNWLKLSVGSADVPCDQLSPEERERTISAADRVLNATSALLERKEDAWLVVESASEDSFNVEWLELYGVARLKTSSGHCLAPDATVCTALTSALFACAGEDATTQRQLTVELSLNNVDENRINFCLRCLAVKGDGYGFCTGGDGGLLAAIMAAAIKGELEHFQVGLSLEVSRLDAWFVEKDGERAPAVYIVHGLCRCCCIPELILRCMQIRVSLLEFHYILNNSANFMELIAASNYELHQLFSCRQLQEFLLFEREYTLRTMEIVEQQVVNS